MPPHVARSIQAEVAVERVAAAEVAAPAVVPPLEQAEDLARRTLAAITEFDWTTADEILAADRERVESDLAGLRQHYPFTDGIGRECCHDSSRPTPCPDAHRYSAGLLRTARLYGVTPADYLEAQTAVPPIGRAEEFGARILAAITERWHESDELGRVMVGRPLDTGSFRAQHLAASRKDVERALEGLRDHHDEGRAVGAVCYACADEWPCDDARRYWSILVDVGALYGVTP